MVIEKINYNWNNGAYSYYVVGIQKVTEITEHKTIGEGDRWFYDVHFEDGRMERIFNPNHVFFKSE